MQGYISVILVQYIKRFEVFKNSKNYEVFLDWYSSTCCKSLFSAISFDYLWFREAKRQIPVFRYISFN